MCVDRVAPEKSQLPSDFHTLSIGNLKHERQGVFMNEIWKDIPNYEGIYQVSNLGNVRSITYQGTPKIRVLKIKYHHSGYSMVTLCKNKIHKNIYIHVLVAKCFISNPLKKPCVNHIDGNKSNNNVSNLEWVTHSENTIHSINKLNHPPFSAKGKLGANHHSSKPILQYSLDGEFLKRWDCMSDVQRELNVKVCSIVNCASGRQKTSHGYIWKYEGN